MVLDPFHRPGSKMDMAAFRRRVYRLVESIPQGRVATYGQIADLAGFPRHARHVGNALGAEHGIPDLPWHRVLNAQGRVSQRNGASHAARPGRVERLQKRKLRADGVSFEGERVDLDRYRWRPEEERGAWAELLESEESGSNRNDLKGSDKS